MPKETRFGDNFARLLGVHRLSAQRAAEILGVSPGSLSHWMNGRREPDRESLYGISIFFLVDPWEIMTASAHDFLGTLGDVQRFDAVEKCIADGVSAAELGREAMAEGRGLKPAADLVESFRRELEDLREKRVSARRGELRKLESVPNEPEK